jgi:hypothetical protein
VLGISNVWECGLSSSLQAETCSCDFSVGSCGRSSGPVQANHPHGSSNRTKPIEFKADVNQAFQLDNSKPEIDSTAEVQVYIRVNAAAARDLVDDDAFHVSAKVPDPREVELPGLKVIDQRRSLKNRFPSTCWTVFKILLHSRPTPATDAQFTSKMASTS